MRPVPRFHARRWFPRAALTRINLGYVRATSAVIFSTRRCYARASFMSMPETKEFFLADVNSRSLLRVVLSLPQHLMRDRSGVAFAECYVLEKVRERVSFAPTEID